MTHTQENWTLAIGLAAMLLGIPFQFFLAWLIDKIFFRDIGGKSCRIF